MFGVWPHTGQAGSFRREAQASYGDIRQARPQGSQGGHGLPVGGGEAEERHDYLKRVTSQGDDEDEGKGQDAAYAAETPHYGVEDAKYYLGRRPLLKGCKFKMSSCK